MLSASHGHRRGPRLFGLGDDLTRRLLRDTRPTPRNIWRGFFGSGRRNPAPMHSIRQPPPLSFSLIRSRIHAHAHSRRVRVGVMYSCTHTLSSPSMYRVSIPESTREDDSERHQAPLFLSFHSLSHYLSLSRSPMYILYISSLSRLSRERAGAAFVANVRRPCCYVTPGHFTRLQGTGYNNVHKGESAREHGILAGRIDYLVWVTETRHLATLVTRCMVDRR